MSDRLDNSAEEIRAFERHLTAASEELRACWRKMRKYKAFERTTKEIADTILDLDEAAQAFREHLTKEQRKREITR